jgi:hypothetical protein
MHPIPKSLRLVALAMFLTTMTAHAGNPLIPTVYSADPSAHVWPGDDRLWIYASHDQPGTNTHDTMISYHVFSSSDLVNWTDYGVVLHLKDVKWAISHMWAIDCVLRDGTYYLVYCAKEKGKGSFRTGLATSARPEGPFTDIGTIQGVEHGQDPAVFVDDDNTPYLYWGSGGRCHAVQLSDDLRSAVPATYVELTKQLHEVFEGPWVHKHQGKYILSYPGLPKGEWPEVMYYATADKPLGPYTFRGCYIPEFEGRSGTNHGSIIQYKGRWLAFHHSAWLSGSQSEVRNLMCDYLTVNPDGSFEPIVPTKEGVAVGGVRAGPSRVTVLLEAENGPAACGELRETRVGRAHAGFSGSGYVEGFGAPGNSVTVFVQSAQARKARLKIRYMAPLGTEMHKVMVNTALLPDPVHGFRTWEKLIDFPAATDWSELDLGLIDLKEGDNTIMVYSGGGAGLAVDCLKLEQVP